MPQRGLKSGLSQAIYNLKISKYCVLKPPLGVWGQY